MRALQRGRLRTCRTRDAGPRFGFSFGSKLEARWLLLLLLPLPLLLLVPFTTMVERTTPLVVLRAAPCAP